MRGFIDLIIRRFVDLMTCFWNQEGDQEPRVDDGITEDLDAVSDSQGRREERDREEADQTHHGEESDGQGPQQAAP